MAIQNFPTWNRLALILAAWFVLSACAFDKPPLAGISPVSGALQITDDDRFLVLAAMDHDEVLILERESGEVRHRVPVSKGPSQVVLDADRAVVTTRYGHRVEVIDVHTGRLMKSIEIGVEPYGLAFVDDNRVAVALSGERALVVVHLEEERIEERIPLSVADPRAVARTADGTLWVTHMAEGKMSVIAPWSKGAEIVDIQTPVPNRPLQAEHLQSLTLSPNGKSLWMAHSQANTEPVRSALTDERVEDVVETGSCGYSGCPGEPPALLPAVTEVSVELSRVVTPLHPSDPRVAAKSSSNETPPDSPPGSASEGPPALPPNLFNPFDVRFAGIPMNNPTALVLFAGGHGMAVLHAGSRNVLLLRRALDGSPSDLWGVVDVGHGASSMVIRHDGGEIFVWNQFDGTITSFAVPSIPDGQIEVSRLSDGVPSEPPENWSAPTAHTRQVVEDALTPQVSLGRKLFHDARDPRISANGTISCATCHPDGRADGRTWKFDFGPRNTPQLGGGILSTAPFHWPGDVGNVHALNHMTILSFMGGRGLDEESLDAIGAFIDQIPAAPTRASAFAELSAAQARGKEIFESVETGCTACHAGPHFTDNVSWNIGSRSTSTQMNDIEAFQTPVLHGLSRTAPYLHDGTVPTLEELVERWVRTNRMGNGSHLSDEDAADLVSYLYTL